MIKNIIFKTIFVLISIFIGIILCELTLRIKHSFFINYDIEMWKYAKKLKQKSSNIKIGHTHIKNSSAKLQDVEIKINNYGQRDVDLSNEMIKNFDRSFLILGSSVALGWGVENSNVFTNVMNNLSKKNDKNWIFINGGVGNYNTERYINNYFENWHVLGFTDIIIHFFVNDTEVIIDNKTNFFTKHTHLGVVVWKLLNSYKSSFNKEKLEDYYKKKYQDNYKGLQTAKIELKKLKKHCDLKKIKCHIVLMPDIHQLKPYKLKFINDKISTFAKELKFNYFDLLPEFENIELEKIWNKYQDPHPNAFAHKIMGEKIYYFLNK